jgi:hypothetical protein
MPSDAIARRVLAKGFSLFLLMELVFMSSQPFLGGWSFYAPGQKRQRLPTSTHAPEDAALEVGDVQTMLASHIVSEPKQPGEFRVLMLGDSAVWGYLLEPSQTLPEQLNAMGLHTCSGKTMRFYNLSYPLAGVTKDLMILDYAIRYQPDMVVWSVSLVTVMSKARIVHWLIPQDAGEIDRLNARFDFLPDGYQTPSAWERLLVQHNKQRQILLFQLASLILLASGREQFYPDTYEKVPTALRRELEFEGMAPPKLRAKQLALDEIQDGYDLASGLPILIVNEPILIVANSPNSEFRYNEYYPRWAYDQYRQMMTAAAAQAGWDYVDLWDLVPAASFTNSPLHLNAAAEAQLAAALAPSVQRLTCP